MPSSISPSAVRPEFRTALLLNRVMSHYSEMPGLSLTQSQADRLFGLDRTTCQAILETLEQVGHLKRLSNGAFVLAKPR